METKETENKIFEFTFKNTWPTIQVYYYQGVQYSEISKDDKYCIHYFDRNYTGKVETEILDTTTFYRQSNTLVHFYGFMTLGKLQEFYAEAQFEDGTFTKINEALYFILSDLNKTITWRPYGKFTE